MKVLSEGSWGLDIFEMLHSLKDSPPSGILHIFENIGVVGLVND